MDTSAFEKIKEKLLIGWDSLIQKSDEEAIAGMGRERIVVFLVALVLAFCLWLMVNLSRDYNLNIDLPIRTAGLPEDKALVENLPEAASVSVIGEGWKLINLYNNPPSINIDISDSEINLYDQVQRQMNALPDIGVQKVQPVVLNVKLDDRISKKVPVRSKANISYKDQYGPLGELNLQPDSITVSGAASLVESIEFWPTDSVQFTGVSKNISRAIALKEPGELISLSRGEVIFHARVTQFTEGEVAVDIETKDLPKGQNVSYSPSSITLKFDIPITEYPQIKGSNLFRAFVSYQQLEEDSTGFVAPQIEQVENKYHIRIRSFQPRRVAYFMVVND